MVQCRFHLGAFVPIVDIIDSKLRDFNPKLWDFNPKLRDFNSKLRDLTFKSTPNNKYKYKRLFSHEAKRRIFHSNLTQ